MSDRTYHKLIVWQEAHQLCLWIYRVTKVFPAEERYSLVDQMRRSASSVPTNIVEGNAKDSKREKVRYFGIAKASLEELHYQCYLAKDLSYISEEDYQYADQHVHKVSYLLRQLCNAFR